MERREEKVEFIYAAVRAGVSDDKLSDLFPDDPDWKELVSAFIELVDLEIKQLGDGMRIDEILSEYGFTRKSCCCCLMLIEDEVERRIKSQQ